MLLVKLKSVTAFGMVLTAVLVLSSMTTSFMAAPKAAASLPQVNAQKSADGDSPPKSNVVLPEGTAKDPLEPLLKAQALSEKVTSTIAVGTFRRFTQDLDDKEMTLRTKANVKICWDRDRYRIHVRYQTNLVRTVLIDRNGVESAPELRENRPETFLINDGKAMYVCRISESNGRKSGLIEIYEPNNYNVLGLRPVRFGRDVFDLKGIIKNLGRDGLTTNSLPKSVVRVSGGIVNSPKVRWEMEARPEIGFNVAKVCVTNPGEDKPAASKTADWKKEKDHWYIKQFTEEHRYRRPGKDGQPDRFELGRTTLAYDSFEINPPLDAKLFRIDGLDMPEGTRTFDRRPNARPGE